jgi:hypothetical protein
MFASGLRPLAGVPLVVPFLLALAACGCGGDGVHRLPVEGTVLIDAEPLRGMKGAVLFLPDKSRGNESPLRGEGEIDAEGRYVLFAHGKPGAPPGHYKVVVSAVPPGAERDASKLAVHPRYVVEADTPLQVEVVSDPAPGHYDLKLTAR